tara:strand:+ start:652 stop:768 length:117 start_codon:yes stop_codon:yes gene_type:complete
MSKSLLLIAAMLMLAACATTEKVNRPVPQGVKYMLENK